MRLLNAIRHFKTIMKHKKWVFYYCHLCGITWRGIKHDLSKFSPTEFLESVRYYTGYRSPIEVCKEQNGVSLAWLHHKGRNDHHYEYWQDEFDQGMVALDMPFECALEMLCDYLGAGRAYMGNSCTYKAEFEWFKKKLDQVNPKMHVHIKSFIYYSLWLLADMEREKGGSLKGYHLGIVFDEPPLKVIYRQTLHYNEERFSQLREKFETTR